jgi:hypothetical protein
MSSGGAVNLGVMTKFVAGDFGGTMVAGSAGLSGNVAQQSVVVVVAFGLLWGFGLLNIGMRHFEVSPSTLISAVYDSRKQKKGNKISMENVPREKVGSLDRSVVSIEQVFLKSLIKYYIAVIPSVYHLQPWWKRLQTQFVKHHRSIAVFSIFWHRSDTLNGNSSKRLNKKNVLSKTTILQVAFVLTSVTISCFTLALLYDIQYPADDGSCSAHRDVVSCLTRTTVLDSSRSYCRWVGESAQPSPGMIEESRGGQVMQVIPLESVLSIQGEDAALCVYDDSNVSGFVMLAVLLMTMIVKVPLDFVLVIIFMVLMANTQDELENRIAASKALYNLWKAQRVPDDSQKCDKRRKGLVVEANQAVTTEVAPVSSRLSLSIRQSSVKIVRQTLSPWKSIWINCTGAWYDIYKIYMELDPHPPHVPTDVGHAHEACVKNWATYQVIASPLPSQAQISPSSGIRRENSRNSKSADEISVMQLQQLWQYATSSEFSMTLLLQLFIDTLKKGSSNNLISKQFAAVVLKEYPLQFYVQQSLHYALTLLLTLINLGALYYVLLKGTTRGYVWQQSLVQICFLDWFIQLAFHQTFEVCFVHYWVPNIIYGDVQEAMGNMQQELTKWVLTRIQKFDAPHIDASIVTSAALNELPLEKQMFRQTWESQFVKYLTRGGSATSDWFFPSKHSTWWVYIWLRQLGSWPVAYQRAVSGVLSSMLFSLLTTIWLVLVSLPGPIASILSICLFLMGLTSTIIYWWRKRSTPIAAVQGHTDAASVLPGLREVNHADHKDSEEGIEKEVVEAGDEEEVEEVVVVVVVEEEEEEEEEEAFQSHVSNSHSYFSFMPQEDMSVHENVHIQGSGSEYDSDSWSLSISFSSDTSGLEKSTSSSMVTDDTHMEQAPNHCNHIDSESWSEALEERCSSSLSDWESLSESEFDYHLPPQPMHLPRSE